MCTHTHTLTHNKDAHTYTDRAHLQRLLNYLWVGGEVTKRDSDSKRAENEMTA